jgi:hypothetical protein
MSTGRHAETSIAGLHSLLTGRFFQLIPAAGHYRDQALLSGTNTARPSQPEAFWGGTAAGKPCSRLICRLIAEMAAKGGYRNCQDTHFNGCQKPVSERLGCLTWPTHFLPPADIVTQLHARRYDWLQSMHSMCYCCEDLGKLPFEQFLNATYAVDLIQSQFRK